MGLEPTLGEVVCRAALRQDLAGIVMLLADDDLGRGREDGSLPVNPRYLAAFESLARDPNQLLVVAEDGGQVVGCLQLTFIPGLTRLGMWRGQIEGVRVARSHRGRGLGETLLRFAIERCRQRGCGLVQLTSDRSRHEAHRFYERLGFEASHAGLKLAL